MRNLIGLEMVCFCASRHFVLEYAGGGYVDEKGEPVDDVMDLACFVCSTSFYTREGDAIPYCPNCGNIERKRFDRREDLVDFLRGFDLSWTGEARLKAAAGKRREGDWVLVLDRDPQALALRGRYLEVRSL